MTLPEDDDLLAAEYVLGTLDLGQRAAAEARLGDPDFAAAVAGWQVRLSGLNAEFGPVAPSPDLLPRIEARLFPVAAPQGWRGALADLRRAAWAWAGAGLATAATLAFLALSPLPVTLGATILAEGGGLEYDARLTAGRLDITRSQGQGAAPGRAHELWLIVGDAAPVSLGLLGEVTRVSLPEAPEGAILAVSLEPAGGSPTGQPTGPVLALGKLVRG